MKGNNWATRELLEQLYVDKNMSTYEIGRLCHITPPTVRYWLLKWGFSVRDKSQAQLGEHNPLWVGGRDQWKDNRLRRYAYDYKERKGCKECHRKGPSYIFDFHHRDPDQKDFDITKCTGLQWIDLSQLIKEIGKCLVLCSNCHNEFHCTNPCHGNTGHQYRSPAATENIATITQIKRQGCRACGYIKCLSALEFHHRDPLKKLFTIGRSQSLYKPPELVRVEIEKCDVLCSVCHRMTERVGFNSRYQG